MKHFFRIFVVLSIVYFADAAYSAVKCTPPTPPEGLSAGGPINVVGNGRTDTSPSTAKSCVTFAPQIAAAAKAYNLDPMLLAAIGMQETGLKNINGDGGHGHGIFQIDDRSHADWLATHNAADPSQNAMEAAKTLNTCFRQFPDDEERAITCYNTGFKSAQNGACGTAAVWPPGTSVCYGDSVLMHLQHLQETGTSANC